MAAELGARFILKSIEMTALNTSSTSIWFYFERSLKCTGKLIYLPFLPLKYALNTFPREMNLYLSRGQIFAGPWTRRIWDGAVFIRYFFWQDELPIFHIPSKSVDSLPKCNELI